MAANNKPTAPLLPVVLAGRCPRCGRGALFNGFLTVAPACSECGLGLAGHDTGDGPAFFVMMPLCILTAVFALLVELRFEPPVWIHAVIWPAFIALFAALTLRPVKAILIAMQYRHRDVEHQDPSNQQ